MGSSSSSSSATTNNTRDARVAGDNGAVGISSEGDVQVHMVADEAFELGGAALAELSDLARSVVDVSGKSTETSSDALRLALQNTQAAGRTETTQIADQLIRIGIPAAALAFAASKIWGK